MASIISGGIRPNSLNEHELMRLFSLLYGLSRLIITQQLHFHAIFLPKTEN